MEDMLPRDCAYHDRCDGHHDPRGRPNVEVGTLAHGDVIDYGPSRTTERTAGMTLTRKIILAASAAVLALGAFTAGLAIGAPDHPSCPTEDSCVADYRDGGWTVVEVTP